MDEWGGLKMWLFYADTLELAVASALETEEERHAQHCPPGERHADRAWKVVSFHDSLESATLRKLFYAMLETLRRGVWNGKCGQGNQRTERGAVLEAFGGNVPPFGAEGRPLHRAPGARQPQGGDARQRDPPHRRLKLMS